LKGILGRACARAYGHAAHYWARLGEIAGSGVGLFPLLSHEDFEVEIRARHGRKSAFWAYVNGTRRDRHDDEDDATAQALSTGRAHSRPRDRRLSRKTRAAVGKPADSAHAMYVDFSGSLS